MTAVTSRLRSKETAPRDGNRRGHDTEGVGFDVRAKYHQRTSAMPMTLEGAVTRWGPWPERFWKKVSEDEESGCWIWTAAQTNGYGIVRVPGARRSTNAHRVAYELSVGPIAPGMVIDHLCRNTACVNPAHLEPVLPRENQRRGLRGELTTHCPRGHEYTTENTRVYRGGRRCRECARLREADRRAAARAAIAAGSLGKGPTAARPKRKKR